MANDPTIPPLPDGFVIQQQAATPTVPAPPDGFTVQGPESSMTPLAVGQQHPVQGPTDDTLGDIGRRVKGAGVNAMAGILSLPMSAAEGVDYLGNKVGVNPGAADALASVKNPFHPDAGPMFPTLGQAKDALYNETGNVEYKPSTVLGQAVDTGLTAAAGGVAGGGIRSIPAALSGGVGSQLANDFAPSWAKLPASFLGFMLGSKAGSAATSVAARVPAAVVGDQSDLYQAYKRQGVPTTLGGDVTQSPTLQFAQATASKMPGGESLIKQASNDAVTAWQKAVENRASLLGNSATMQDAGTALQKGAQDWLNNFKSQSNQNWNNFKLLVPGSTAIPVQNFQKTLAGINQQYGGADGLASVLQPKMAQQLQEALTTDAPNGTLPWQAVQSARSRIGEMLETNEPIADTGKAALKQIYGALSQDMRDGAASVSAPAAAAFDKANSYTATGHTLLDDHITPILNATNPEQAAQYAMQQMRLGGSRVAALDQALPGSGNDLGAVALRQAAANGPGRFPAALADNRISPEAKSVLFGPQQGAVDDLTAIANAQKSTAQMVNHSNTSVTHDRGLGRIVAAGEMGRAGFDVAGHAGAAVGAGLGFFGPNLLGKSAGMLATNPWVTRLMATPAPAPFGIPSMVNPQGALARYQAMLPALTGQQP